MNILEMFFYLNILLFTTFTWYCLGECRNKEAVAYILVTIALIVLILIILYHVYMYTIVFLKIKKTKIGKTVDKLFTTSEPKPKPECHWIPPPDDDIHRFNELLDIIDRPVNTSNYEVPLQKQPVQKPTQSMVEIDHPQLAPSDPEEAISQQHVQ